MSRLELRFLLSAAAAALLPLLLVWGVGYKVLEHTLYDAAGAKVAATASRLATVLEARIETERRVLTALCTVGGNPYRTAVTALAFLAELDAVEVELDGRHAADSRFTVLPPGAHLPRVPAGSVRRDAWGEPTLRIEVDCSRGRLRGDVRLRPALDLFRQVPRGITARLYGPQNALLASSDLSEVLTGSPRPIQGALRVEQSLGNGWRLEVLAPRTTLLLPLRKASAGMVLLLLFALAASALPGVRLARSLTRPLVELAEGARAFTAGQVPPALTETGPEEARLAIRAFNRMAKAQAARTETLAEAVKARTRELALALEKAEAASRAKTRFLAAISHELRTPLTNIKGYASTLLSPDVIWRPEDAREFLRIIEEEADRLDHLVNDLLDFARAERGELALLPIPMELSTWLKELEPRLRELAPAHPLTLVLPPEPVRVIADPERLLSLVFNLVENAGRHTPPGTPIRVGIATNEESAVLFVEDRGPGIPDAIKARVTEPFFQGERTAKGSGLGLAIAKMVAEAHGGKLLIEDTPGGGLRVVAHLPREKRDAGTDRG